MAKRWMPCQVVSGQDSSAPPLSLAPPGVLLALVWLGSPCGGFLVRVVEPESGGRGGAEVVVGQVAEVVDVAFVAFVALLRRAAGGCFGAVVPIAGFGEREVSGP